MPEYAHPIGSRTTPVASDHVGVRRARSPVASASATPAADTLQAVLNGGPRGEALVHLKRALNTRSANPSAPLQRTPGAPVQRLSVNGTQWGNVTSITASSSGVAGVLFMNDGVAPVVVKPNTSPDDEALAAHVHGQLGRHGFLERNKWQIKGLESHMATAADVAGIAAAGARVGAGAPLTPRANALLGAVAAGTTLIQEAATMPASGYRELLANVAGAHHIIPAEERARSSKDKIKKTSSLKLLTHHPDFISSLGRLAAADIFVGNFDRLMMSANLENLLVNVNTKQVFAIDNVHDASRARFGHLPVDAPVTLVRWATHPFVAKFIARDFAWLAAEAWNPGITEHTHVSIWSDITEGSVAGPAPAPGAAAPQQPTVLPVERPAVRAKLQRHLERIRGHFAAGLAEGMDLILAAGNLPAGVNASPAARTQYDLRIAALRQG